MHDVLSHSEDICRKFNSIDLHDSELISFALLERESGDIGKAGDLSFRLKLLTDPKKHHFKRAELILRDCRITKINIDLVEKGYCSGAILANSCSADSELKRQIHRAYVSREVMLARYEDDPLVEYVHFNITLVPGGGEIDILAKDFKLEVEEKQDPD